MKVSQYFLFTLRNSSKEESMVSHQLMMKGGFIRKISSGLYSWLPTGVRVLNKIKYIIREEMNKIGALEISMPIIQSVNLWKRSGRFYKYGEELFFFKDRKLREFILSPTHEELVTYLIGRENLSFNKFPLIVYQIETKFRDEIRPSFGVIRSREFIMKDAYSFHINKNSLENTYHLMSKAYKKIFRRVGLNVVMIKAKSGVIGGDLSHEFQSFAFDDNLISPKKEYYNLCLKNDVKCLTNSMHVVELKNVYNISQLTSMYNVSLKNIVKSIVVKAKKNNKFNFVVILCRWDHAIDNKLCENHPLIKSPIEFATEDEIYEIFKVSSFFVGPINSKIPVITDSNVAKMKNFIAGGNIKNIYYCCINWNRDIKLTNVCNLVKMQSIKHQIKFRRIKNIIEVGHIFQVGKEYSKFIGASIRNNDGIKKTLNMGCYGIGVTRLVSAIIEENHDNNGIIWPDSVSPFLIGIVPVNMYKNSLIKDVSEKIYSVLIKNKVDVIFDDRNESFGVMLSDMELIGIPHIIIIGNKYLNFNVIEYRNRKNHYKQLVNYSNIFLFLKHKCNILNDL